MNTVIVNEQQLEIEIDALKADFPETKDIYREACVLLFFRYGITPTANKLYQYVRRGSMSAPADALNKFWLELREKSRVRIERTDIPENIAAVAGDLIANLWNEAQKAAQAGFSQLVDNATAEILKYKLQSEVAEQKAAKTEHVLTEIQVELKNALKRLSETENLRMVDMLSLG
ncbi:MAG: DNA-binding protein [Methylotenera sp.]